MNRITRISISEKTCNSAKIHPAARREKQIILHDGWEWHMGDIQNKEQLEDFLNFFNIEFTGIHHEVEYETTGKIYFYNLSKNIKTYKQYFWNLEQLKEFSNGAELKKVKGLSNGSIVDCYAEINDNEVVIYRPNPNAKEVYNPMEFEKELNYRCNKWYI